MLYSYKGHKEKGAEFALRTLVLQFHEDLNEREMERFLQENLSGKWFCDLGLGLGLGEKHQIIVILVSFASVLVLNG